MNVAVKDWIVDRIWETVIATAVAVLIVSVAIILLYLVGS